MLRRWADAIRRNHALEHATVAVLLARSGPRRLAGRATRDGFFLFGDVTQDEALWCAEDALRRLQAGQASLAVSPLCGTNIAVAGFVAAAAATAVLSIGPARGRFPNAFLAAMLGVIFAQPLGRLVQQRITTSPDLDGVEIAGASAEIAGTSVEIAGGQLLKVLTRGAMR